MTIAVLSSCQQLLEITYAISSLFKMGKKWTQSGITNFFSKAGHSDSKISKTSENTDIKATENEKNNDKGEENIENTDTTNVQVEKCSECAEKPENRFLICKHIDCPLLP